ncbi:MAG: DeoR/GlpR family DNA-binding transcription regulator [Tropicimonas sp.]|uniref:DeoR/GlpR family DNA-binding transcription regulator n=1 Tax=Tropicimonas sp. TaxID=2067044 RepID=UPI003A86B61F
MLAVERQRSILESIVQDRRVLVSELSARYGVSEETIRRDLQKLERNGRVSRTHGGAVLVPRGEPEDLPYPTRQVTNISQKRALTAVAARLVPDGAAIMVDSSSTALELMPALAQRRDLTIITNSVHILTSRHCENHTVISVGGELRQRSLTLSGHAAIDNIARYAADISFISCKALSAQKGVMDPSLADASIKQAFIGAAQKVCLLVDSAKFDQTGLISVCDLSRIDILATDRQPSAEWCDFIAGYGTELLVA